jgi:kynureninase
VSYKSHFSRALGTAPERLHLAAHSHHLWPDVSFAAQVRAWEDAARHADRKWAHLFEELVPRAQAHVARRLGVGDGASIAFAPNTHALVLRILSCLPVDRPPRILTTGSEFHSFARQLARLEEDGLVRVERVPAEPFASFIDRFSEAVANGGHDLVYVSHVFFDSGWVVPDLPALVRAVPSPDTFFVVDGYHAFMALPVDLSEIRDRVFYLAGGYKYAMSGEGVCFLHAPPGYGERPRNTGWFAQFGALNAAHDGRVSYAPGGARFLGATFDPTALHRFDAVMTWLDEIGVTPVDIHEHAHRLQRRFVAGLGPEHAPLSAGALVVPIDDENRGQFLTFRSEQAPRVEARFAAADIVTDVRGDRLRIGFGLYHDEGDVDVALTRMREAMRKEQR